ncbi:hypothetical protein B0H16DRAFT_1456877 [Mycena metata]|uniref:Uncharacterized protein n=1 Tax=Mycena metata TaxID=1033252 RepID=A0AAD7NF92_9AGAR|nr:hypothetical protein B0H16DRAFT_1456877 [Mycena metata]
MILCERDHESLKEFHSGCVNGSGGGGGGGEAVALRCGAEERITAENLVQGDWDEGRGWEVQMLPDSPSPSERRSKSRRRETRTNGCGAPVHGAVQGNGNGGYWFAWDSRGVEGGQGGVAGTVVPLDMAYFPDALRKGLRLGEGGAACARAGWCCIHDEGTNDVAQRYRPRPTPLRRPSVLADSSASMWRRPVWDGDADCQAHAKKRQRAMPD